jgi:hypothetical protein
MTWKTYAAVSGATVIAGWLASSPPSNTPAPAAAPQQRRPAPAAATRAAEADIEQQAARLQARTREQQEFHEPARNPFNFAARQAPPGPVAPREPEPMQEFAPPPPSPPPPPSVRLSGIAEERSGERVERTAVLSSPSGVLLVREGDDVLGQYRVERIEADAVELSRTDDGSRLRLSMPIGF